MKVLIRTSSLLLSLIFVFSIFSQVGLTVYAADAPSCVSLKATAITNSTARVEFKINNPSGFKIQSCGMQIRKKGTSAWTTKSKKVSASNQSKASISVNYYVGKGKEFGFDLTKNTKYEYRGYCVYKGKKYYTPAKTFTTKNNDYSSDYRRWSQNKSYYRWMRKYGCGIVAYAKLIRESGINTDETFDPDVYYSYCIKNGFLGENGFISGNGENALIAYAKERGNTVKKVNPKGNTNNQRAKNNAKSGYFTICQTGRHYILVNNEQTNLTKGTGSNSIYIYDSWSYKMTGTPPAVVTLSGKGANGSYNTGVTAKTIKELYTFKVKINTTSATMSTMAVSKRTNTSANLNFTINNPKYEKIIKCGVMISKDGKKWKTLTENVKKANVSHKSISVSYAVGKGKKLNYSLSKNTQYYYKGFFITSYGVKKYTKKNSFKTTNKDSTSMPSKATTTASTATTTVPSTTTTKVDLTE